MLIFLAIALLILLPSPWNFVAAIAVTVLWVFELMAWSRTVKRRRVVVGAHTLIGREAIVSSPCRPTGQVRVQGEIWEARCEAGASVGDRVRVSGYDRLTLIVEPTGAGNG
jgi:membrane-bound serine protease (ClpP class)